jgi:phosphatidylglycerol:prolipoprotein diacylglycerol transferase
MIVLLLISVCGAVFGSHLLYALVNLVNISSGQSVNEITRILFGGSVFYGGLLGGVFIGCWYAKTYIRCHDIIDIVTPAIPLFHFFGRIGCFLTGCCFGVESKFGFIFKNSIVPGANDVRRFPVQVVEAGFNLAMFFLLDFLRREGYFRQKLLYVYLLLYSVIRFVLEFLRGDDYRGKLSVFSISQIISVFLVCFAMTKLWRYRQTAQKSTTA